MSYAFAGLYAEPFQTKSGRGLGGAIVQVFNTDPDTLAATTPATLYTDRTKEDEAPNPFTCDAAGNGTCFADPGYYRFEVTYGGSIVLARAAAGALDKIDPDPSESESDDSTHSGLATGVHGVAGSTVESTAGSQAKVDAHDVTIGVHGIADTALVVLRSGTLGSNRVLFANASGEAKSSADLTWDDTTKLLDVNGQVDIAGVANSAFQLRLIAANTDSLQKPAALLQDSAGTLGPLLQLNHFGAGHVDVAALDIHNYVGAAGALSIHQYSSVSTAAIQVDNTGRQPMFVLRNTENQTLNPGSTGMGDYVQFEGYDPTTFADGSITSGLPTLTSPTAAFVASDVGREIVATGVSDFTYILSVESATSVTLSANATATTTGTLSFQISRVKAPIALLSRNLVFLAKSTSLPFQFIPAVAVDGLRILQARAARGLVITKTGSDANNALTISHTSPGRAVQITPTSGAAGFYPLAVSGYDYGPLFDTSQNGGDVVQITKNGTGSGRAMVITNKGTGLSLDVRSASASLFAITAAGLPQWVAAGNQQTTVGAAGGASALPATPTKYLKVVDSAGTAYVIPAYAAS